MKEWGLHHHIRLVAGIHGCMKASFLAFCREAMTETLTYLLVLQ